MWKFNVTSLRRWPGGLGAADEQCAMHAAEMLCAPHSWCTVLWWFVDVWMRLLMAWNRHFNRCQCQLVDAAWRCWTGGRRRRGTLAALIRTATFDVSLCWLVVCCRWWGTFHAAAACKHQHCHSDPTPWPTPTVWFR